MTVRIVESEEDILRFLELTRRVYQESPHWVPQGDSHIGEFLREESPFSSHCKTCSFLLEDGADVVARVMVQIDVAMNTHWGEDVGHLLFFEALDGLGLLVNELFEMALNWLKEEGIEVARLSYLHGRQLPLTIDAYGVTPTVFHSSNPAYYHNYIKAAGFESDKGFSEHRIDLSPQLLDLYRENVKSAEEKGVHFRPFNFSNVEEETRLILEIHNVSFRDHWGSVQLEFAEAMALTDGSRDVVIPDFIVLAERNNETFAFMYGLPDLNQAFHKWMGREVDLGSDEFREALQRVDHGLLLIGGVKPGSQDIKVGQAMGSWIMLSMARKGYRSVSPTLILDTNYPARRYMEKLGSRPYRNFVTYRKILVR